MKRLLIAALAAFFSFLLSCQKIIDFEAPCKILTLTENYQFDPSSPVQTTTYTFNYNSHGDPIAILCSNPITGKPNYFFTYDHKKRLKQSYQMYGPGNIEFYSIYYYTNNFITLDTTFIYGGDINNPYSTFQYYQVRKYSYDSKGRISRVDNWLPVAGQQWSDVYAYDANGNLINGSTYDDKLYFHRTHLVLSFMDRNYSMNNSGSPVTYNSKKLPLTFLNTWQTDPQARFQNTMVHEITYDCGHGHHGGD